MFSALTMKRDLRCGIKHRNRTHRHRIDSILFVCLYRVDLSLFVFIGIVLISIIVCWYRIGCFSCISASVSISFVVYRLFFLYIGIVSINFIVYGNRFVFLYIGICID